MARLIRRSYLFVQSILQGMHLREKRKFVSVKLALFGKCSRMQGQLFVSDSYRQTRGACFSKAWLAMLRVEQRHCRSESTVTNLTALQLRDHFCCSRNFSVVFQWSCWSLPTLLRALASPNRSLARRSIFHRPILRADPSPLLIWKRQYTLIIII